MNLLHLSLLFVDTVTAQDVALAPRAGAVTIHLPTLWHTPFLSFPYNSILTFLLHHYHNPPLPSQQQRYKTNLHIFSQFFSQN